MLSAAVNYIHRVLRVNYGIHKISTKYIWSYIKLYYHFKHFVCACVWPLIISAICHIRTPLERQVILTEARRTIWHEFPSNSQNNTVQYRWLKLLYKPVYQCTFYYF